MDILQNEDELLDNFVFAIRDKTFVYYNQLEKKKQKNFSLIQFPGGINLLKVNNRNTERMCEICRKLTSKTPEPRYWRRSGVFIVNLERISHLLLVFLLLTLNM